MTTEPAKTAEELRLEEAREKAVPWRQRGPYLSACARKLDGTLVRIDTMWVRGKIDLIGSLGALGRSTVQGADEVRSPGTIEVDGQGRQWFWPSPGTLHEPRPSPR
jgi:hypothetical protein